MAIGVEKGTGKFAGLLYDLMDKKELSIKDLAEKVDATYEHIRKMLKGLSFPSTLMMKALARELHVAYDVLAEAATNDRLERRYGVAILNKVTKQSPETAPFSPILPKLTEEQRDSLLSLAKTYERQNRESAKR